MGGSKIFSGLDHPPPLVDGMAGPNKNLDIHYTNNNLALLSSLKKIKDVRFYFQTGNVSCQKKINGRANKRGEG